MKSRFALGRPAHEGPPRVGQTYEGTDRQCRGRILAVLRSSDIPVDREELMATWPDLHQAARALSSLVADGLAVETGPDLFALPD